MLKYGAQSVYKLGIGSDDEDDILSYFKNWKKEIWPSLVAAFGKPGSGSITIEGPIDVHTIGAMEEEAPPGLKDEKKKLPFECLISSFSKEKQFSELNKNSDKYDFRFRNWLQCDTLRIMNVAELRDYPSEDSFTCLMELLLPKTQKNFKSTNLKYPVAGNISIYPTNTKEKVERLAKLLNTPKDMIYQVKSLNGSKYRIPEVVSLENFAKCFIDLNGKVTEKDFSRLSEMLTEKEWFQVSQFRKKMESQKLIYNILDLFETVPIVTSDLLSVLVSLNKDIKVT